MISIKEIVSKTFNARTALTNCSDPQIEPLMADFGYDSMALSEGLEHITRVEELIAKQSVEYGEQYEATEELNYRFEVAQKAYNTTIALARIAFRGNTRLQEKLVLSGKRKKSFSGWISDAHEFYLNCDAEVLDGLARYGRTPEKIEGEKALLEDLRSARAKQLTEIGEAQAATEERDSAIDAFILWINDFYTVAKIALGDHPQLSEKLGIIDPS